MNERIGIKSISAIENMINTRLLVQIFDFAKLIAGEEKRIEIKRVFKQGIWRVLSCVEETIQGEYGFRYFGEMLERFAERITPDIRNIRTLAIGFSLFDELLPENAYVDGQRADFIKNLEKNSDDFIINCALQLIKNGEIEWDSDFETTEQVVIALSMTKDFVQAFEKIKPQIVDLLGPKRTMPVEDNGDVFAWLSEMIYSYDIPLKKAGNELFRAIITIGSKRLKPGCRERSVLEKYGYNDRDISYLEYWIITNRFFRCKIKAHAMAGEKIAADFVLNFLNSEETHTESTYKLLEYVLKAYSTFDVKYNGYFGIKEAIDSDLKIVNPYTFFKVRGWTHNDKRHVDLFDKKWDVLYELMTEETYEDLFVNILFYDSPDKSKMEKYMSCYFNITGKKMIEWYNGEYDYRKRIIMHRMAELNIINIWTCFENAIKENDDNMKKYVEEVVFEVMDVTIFGFWTKYFDKYTVRDFSEFFSNEHKKFVFFVEIYRYSTNCEKRFDIEFKNSSLNDEQKKECLKWAEAYFFEFKSDNYLEFIQSILLDIEAKRVIEFNIRKEMYDTLVKFKPELKQSQSMCEEYLTKEELDAIQRRKEREMERAAILEKIKTKKDFENDFRKIYDGTYNSLTKFTDRFSWGMYDECIKDKIKPVFKALLRKNKPLSKKEFLNFIELCRWMARNNQLSYDEIKTMITETEVM